MSPEKISIGIRSEVVNFVENQAKVAGERETGGIIGGRGTIEKHNVVITNASGPGPRAIHEKAFFSRDTKYCQSLADTWARKTLGNIDYLGEWHKHLEPNPWPSPRDIRTLKNIAGNKYYHVNNPILIIIGISSQRESIKLFVFDKAGRFSQADWVISD